MDSSIGGERSDQEKQKKGRAVRPVLPADLNFSPFFAFIAKTSPETPFGIPRAFQPPK